MPGTFAAVVLCGGKSLRMGREKATLPIGNEIMVARVARQVAKVAEPVFIVRSPSVPMVGLELTGVKVVVDRTTDRGPLEGLYMGLLAASDYSSWAFVVSCDRPLIRPAVAKKMYDYCDGYDSVVLQVGGIDDPLTALYATRLHARADEQLAKGQRSLQMLLRSSRVRRLGPADLADVDEPLDSFIDVNTPDAYAQVLANKKQF